MTARKPHRSARAREQAGRDTTLPATLLFAFLSLAHPAAALADIVNDVTASGSSAAGPVSGSASANVDVADANAVLAVVKSGVLNDDNGIVGQNAGDTIDWTILVRNDGNVTIETITVSDTLGTPVCPGSGNATIASLAPGASETCTLSYALTQGDFDSNGGGDGDIDNTATADGAALGGIGATSGSDSAAVAISVTS